MKQEATNSDGHAVDVAADRNLLLTNPALAIAAMARRAGGIGVCKILGNNILAISDALLSARIQYDQDKLFCRSRQQKQLNGMFGRGLLTEEADEWSELHDSVNNSFGRNNISKYHNTILAAIDANIENLSEPGETLELRLGHDTISWSIGTISSVLLGQRLSNAEINQILNAYLDREQQTLEPTADKQPRSPFARLLKRMRRISSEIERRLAAPVNKALQQNPEATPNLLLDINAELQRESRCPFSHQQHNDLLKTLFLAGIQTSAYTLDWTLILLARHPQHWHRLATAVRGRLGQSPPSSDDLDALEPVQEVIKEVMRLRPVIHTIQKGVSKPLALAGVDLSPGDTINLSLLGIHNSDAYWADPDVFRPERFATDIEPQAFTPFGLGQHTCLGQHLALHVLRATLIRLLQRFDIVADPSLSLETESTFLLKPAHHHVIGLQPIDALPQERT